jgi:hypothetical protein
MANETDTATAARRFRCAACEHVIEGTAPPTTCPNCGLVAGEVNVGPKPPRDGREWHSQCARCGSSTYAVDCDRCGGEGTTAPGELYEEDPLWYDEDAVELCHQCGGEASWEVCCSDAAWCEANPLPGREKVKRGAIEWSAAREDAA